MPAQWLLRYLCGILVALYIQIHSSHGDASFLVRCFTYYSGMFTEVFKDEQWHANFEVEFSSAAVGNASCRQKKRVQTVTLPALAFRYMLDLMVNQVFLLL